MGKQFGSGKRTPFTFIFIIVALPLIDGYASYLADIAANTAKEVLVERGAEFVTKHVGKEYSDRLAVMVTDNVATHLAPKKRTLSTPPIAGAIEATPKEYFVEVGDIFDECLEKIPELLEPTLISKSPGLSSHMRASPSRATRSTPHTNSHAVTSPNLSHTSHGMHAHPGTRNTPPSTTKVAGHPNATAIATTEAKLSVNGASPTGVPTILLVHNAGPGASAKVATMVSQSTGGQTSTQKSSKNPSAADATGQPSTSILTGFFGRETVHAGHKAADHILGTVMGKLVADQALQFAGSQSSAYKPSAKSSATDATVQSNVGVMATTGANMLTDFFGREAVHAVHEAVTLAAGHVLGTAMGKLVANQALQLAGSKSSAHKSTTTSSSGSTHHPSHDAMHAASHNSTHSAHSATVVGTKQHLSEKLDISPTKPKAASGSWWG